MCKNGVSDPFPTLKSIGGIKVVCQGKRIIQESEASHRVKNLTPYLYRTDEKDRTVGRMDGWEGLDGWMSGWMDGWTDGKDWMNG